MRTCFRLFEVATEKKKKIRKPSSIFGRSLERGVTNDQGSKTGDELKIAVRPSSQSGRTDVFIDAFWHLYEKVKIWRWQSDQYHYMGRPMI